MASELIVIEQKNALSIFTGGDLDPLLAKIETEARKHVPNLKTDKGRKAIASNARKVSSSKVIIENARKELVAKMVRDKRAIDEEGKRSVAFCDSLRDELRKPLTDWEDAEKDRIAAEKLAAEFAADFDKATAENDLFNRQKAVEAAEAKLAAEAEEKRLAEDARLAEEQRVAREAQIALEATQKTEREAAEALQAETNRAAQAETDRIAAEQRVVIEREQAAERLLAAEQQAEVDRVAAEQRLEVERQQAEERRVAAEQQAETDRLESIAAAKRQAQAETDRLERERVAEAKRLSDEADKKAANVSHQRSINKKALECLTENGIDEVTGKQLITLIAKGAIDFVTINY